MILSKYEKKNSTESFNSPLDTQDLTYSADLNLKLTLLLMKK